MKKFLSFALVAVMLFATIAVVAFAETPKADDFIAGEGFCVYEGPSYGEAETDGTKTPAIVSDDAKGVKVSHGGYYKNVPAGDLGGVATAEKYDLDGLEITIQFEKILHSSDCWLAIDFLENPETFNAGGDFAKNRGIVQLIRYANSYTQVSDPNAWDVGYYDSQAEDLSVNGIFDITDGDSITVKLNAVDRGSGIYTMTYGAEGYDDFTAPTEFDLSEIFPDGKAYIVIEVSSLGAKDGDFVYYITDITNGEAITEEEIEAYNAVKAAAAVEEALEEAQKEIELVTEKVDEAVAKAAESGDADAIAKAAEASDALAEAIAAVADKDPELAISKCDEARDYVKEANDLIKKAEKTDEEAGEETAADDSADSTAPAAAASSAGFPVWAIILIIVAVIVVIVCIVVAATKKKK